jgi:Membrane-associated sensor, integral membrane domain
VSSALSLKASQAPKGNQGLVRPYRALTLAILVVAAVASAVLPVDGRQLGASASFVPAMLALVSCFDLLSVVFLLREFLDTGDRLPLRLSWAYIFALAVLAGYAAAFPGVLGAKPPLALHPSTAPWLWVAWHGGFPVLLAVAMMARRVPATAPAPDRRRLMATSLLACVGGGAICVVVASWGGGLLPVIIHGTNT